MVEKQLFLFIFFIGIVFLVLISVLAYFAYGEYEKINEVCVEVEGETSWGGAFAWFICETDTGIYYYNSTGMGNLVVQEKDVDIRFA